MAWEERVAVQVDIVLIRAAEVSHAEGVHGMDEEQTHIRREKRLFCRFRR